MKTGLVNLQVVAGMNKQINDTFKIIYTRRAIRKFKNQAIDKIKIDQIIDAGRMAPSAMNRQPWKFYVLTDKGLIKDFSKQISKASIKGIAKMGIKTIAKSVISSLLHPHSLAFLKEDDFIFHGAPVVIFITASAGNEWASLDIGACAQNIMLAAKSLELDSCPVWLAKFVMDTEIYAKLKVPKNDSVRLAICIGYGELSTEVPERKINNQFYIY